LDFHLIAKFEQFSEMGVNQMENHTDPYLEKYLVKDADVVSNEAQNKATMHRFIEEIYHQGNIL
jgi:hypothetical protein